MNYYRPEKYSEAGIDLPIGESSPIYGPLEVGGRKGKDDVAPLAEIIDILNERFGTSFTKAVQLFFDQVTEKARADEEVLQKAGQRLRQLRPVDPGEGPRPGDRADGRERRDRRPVILG